MIKKTSVLAAIVGVAALGVAVAQAASSKTYTVKQSEKSVLVKTNNPPGPPQKGKYQLSAGTLSGSPGGNGAIVDDAVFAGVFGPTGVPITGTVTFFEPDGSYSGALSGMNTPHGSKATVTITKGTGLYKGATGKVTLAGGFNAPFTVTGSIKGGGVAPASGSGKTNAVKQSGDMAYVKSNNSQGAPQKGKYFLYAGTLSGLPGGKGAIIFDQVFAGVFGPTGVPITGTVTFFEPLGSYSGRVSGTNTPHGSQDTVTITKGTGLYKGATGKLTLTGGNPGNVAENTPIAITVTGSIKY
jgi:hypothetical protein